MEGCNASCESRVGKDDIRVSYSPSAPSLTNRTRRHTGSGLLKPIHRNPVYSLEQPFHPSSSSPAQRPPFNIRSIAQQLVWEMQVEEHAFSGRVAQEGDASCELVDEEYIVLECLTGEEESEDEVELTEVGEEDVEFSACY